MSTSSPKPHTHEAPSEGSPKAPLVPSGAAPTAPKDSFSGASLNALAGIKNQNRSHPFLSDVDQTILGLLAAMGPLGVQACVNECREQSGAFQTVPKVERRAVVKARIEAMIELGFVEPYDDIEDAYDPTGLGHAVLNLASYPEAIHSKIARAFDPKKPFNLLASALNGHHYWLEPMTAKIAVTDRSADNEAGDVNPPNSNGHDLCYLDLRRGMDPCGESPRDGYMVPVVDSKGKMSALRAGLFEAEMLEALFDLRMKVKPSRSTATLGSPTMSSTSNPGVPIYTILVAMPDGKSHRLYRAVEVADDVLTDRDEPRMDRGEDVDLSAWKQGDPLPGDFLLGLNCGDSTTNRIIFENWITHQQLTNH